MKCDEYDRVSETQQGSAESACGDFRQYRRRVVQHWIHLAYSDKIRVDRENDCVDGDRINYGRSLHRIGGMALEEIEAKEMNLSDPENLYYIAAIVSSMIVLMTYFLLSREPKRRHGH